MEVASAYFLKGTLLDEVLQILLFFSHLYVENNKKLKKRIETLTFGLGDHSNHCIIILKIK
jgi:hypothetical protein